MFNKFAIWNNVLQKTIWGSLKTKKYTLLHNSYEIITPSNNRCTKTRWKIVWNLTLKTKSKQYLHHFGDFIVDYEHTFTPWANGSIINFYHVPICWVNFQVFFSSVISIVIPDGSPLDEGEQKIYFFFY